MKSARMTVTKQTKKKWLFMHIPIVMNAPTPPVNWIADCGQVNSDRRSTLVTQRLTPFRGDFTGWSVASSAVGNKGSIIMLRRHLSVKSQIICGIKNLISGPGIRMVMSGSSISGITLEILERGAGDTGAKACRL